MSEALQQSFEGGAFLDDITMRGYSEMPHAITTDEIESAVDAYASFTRAHPDPLPSTMDAMLPGTDEKIHKKLDDLDRSKDTQDTWHKYRTNTEGVGKPDGYTNRSLQDQALLKARSISLDEDPKEYFHYTKTWLAKMNRNHRDFAWGELPPEVFNLESAFRPIHQKSAELLLKICASIEETHPEIKHFFTASSIASSPVRLLFYHPTIKDQLGKGHYDKSAVTLQLAESHQGLRIAPDENSDLVSVIRGPETAAVFAGDSLQVNFGHDTPYQPAWHDIIKTSLENEGRVVPPRASEVCARWAMIFFANGKNFINPDKDKMHTR